MATICLKLVNYILFDLQVRFASIFSEPWVAPYLIQSDSVLAVESEELEDEFPEGWGELVDFVNSAPISIQFVVENVFVKLVIFGGFSEWVDSSHHDEENDSDGEDVDFFTVVDFSLFDLWGHVGFGTSELAELLDSFLSCEPKVSKLDGEVASEQHVF